ncbi:MAG: hypothetical protein QUS08_04750 [Methanothrix sp.]|nr:hypothetical protein [Methanothrix sp.]
MDGADGWYELPLYLEYERQADVSVVDGIPSPLYLRENLSTGVTVLVQGAEGPLEVMGVSCDLHPGGSDLLVAAIKNRGRDQLHGCSARLVLFPPFSDEGAAVVLGDLLPGDVAVAGFPLSVDSGAAVQDYQLLLQLEYLEGRSMLSLPVSLSTSGRGLLLPIGAAVAVAALAALLAARWSRRPRRWRRTR